MAIELRNPLTITEETKIYGHNTVDIDGVPTDAGNGNVGQIVDIVDTKYIQGIKTDIDNIKAKINGEIYRTQLVDANAYQIDVPSPVFPYAEVQKLKGKSVVCNQLVPPFNNTKTSNGITIAGDGSGKLTITVSSEVTEYNQVILGEINLIQGHKYLMFDSDKANGFEFYVSGYSGLYGKSFIFEASSTVSQSILYYVAQTTPSGTYIKRPMIIDLTQMFGSGNEPTLEECQKIFSADYYPYDEGTLKSFPVKRVKSVGRNLLKPTLQSETKNGVTCTNNGDGTYTLNGTCTAQTDFYLENFILEVGKYKLIGNPNEVHDGNLFLGLLDINNGYSIGDLCYVKNGALVDNTIKQTCYLVIRIYKGYVISNAIFKPMLTTDLNATYDDFVPYMESTIDLSSATADMKSALSVADEWQNGKVTKRVGVVDLGTLNWTYATDSMSIFYFLSQIPDIKFQDGANNKANIICTKYMAEKWSYIGNTSSYDKKIGVSYVNNDIGITDSSYTDADTFKSAMSGVMLYYELATPTEETVPLTEQFIDVESKGTLTFISDESVQMPIESTTKFVVNLEEV